MRFVPFAIMNIIFIGEMISQGYKYVGSKWNARCTREDTWCCEDKKIKVTLLFGWTSLEDEP